ncbi:MAG: DNA translocase FtsK [Pyramidobacter sp.]
MRQPRRSFEFRALFRLCQLLLAALLLYVTASLFAIGVGVLGKDMASGILRYAGGGVIIILLHFFYGLFCSLMGRSVSSVFSQWLGTLSLYCALSLLMGLLKTAWLHSEIGLLSPGILGSAAAKILPRMVGAVGTVLVGLCLVILSAFNYGYLRSERIHRVREFFAKLRFPSFRRSADVEGDEAVEGVENEPLEQQVLPPEDGAEECENGQASEFPAESMENGGDIDSGSDMASEEDSDFSEEETDLRERRGGTSILTSLGAALSALFNRGGTPSQSDEDSFADEEEDDSETTDQQGKSCDEQFSEENYAYENESFPQSDIFQKKDPQWSATEGQSLAERSPAAESPAAPPPVEPPSTREDQSLRQEQGDGLFALAGGSGELDVSSAVSKGAQVEIDPSGALKGTEEREYVGGREIPKGSFPPPLDLLGPHQDIKEVIDDRQALENGQEVIQTLKNFDVAADLKHTIIGPTVVQYQIQLAAGIKVSKVSALGNDIAVALGVPSIRVEAPIPGTSYIGIELPNTHRRAVPLRQILESNAFQTTKLSLPLPLGQTVDGRILITGLEELPHLLIAGTTGSGKSIFINNCIVALCYHNTPADLRFIMVDPKRVEMGIYESLPHILAKPIVTSNGAVHALAWAVREMERRYDACSQIKARSIASYNEKVLPKDRMPHIVIIVDELADLMMTAQKEVEEYIMRLAQMARAVGIHLMLATQRPSVNVLTGTIKANIPARVSFSLPSVADSRTILDATGAQNLLGKGDMLFVSTRHPHPRRIQSPFMDEQTNIRVVEYLRNTFGDPEYVDLEDQGDAKGGSDSNAFLEDSRLEEAIKIVLTTGVASSSGLQRQMRIGFTRAARMIDTMESMGIVGPQNGAKPREIFVDEGEALEILEQRREGR